MRTIRRIAKGEWALYKQLRLAALMEAPDAFSTTYESAALRSDESWAAQADASAEGPDRFTFVAFLDQAPVGLAAVYRDADGSAQGELIQVWVSPASRGTGLAAELVDAVVHCAKNHGFDKIRAEVFVSNQRAIRFYQGRGFKIDDAPSVHSAHSIVLAR